MTLLREIQRNFPPGVQLSFYVFSLSFKKEYNTCLSIKEKKKKNLCIDFSIEFYLFLRYNAMSFVIHVSSLLFVVEDDTRENCISSHVSNTLHFYVCLMSFLLYRFLVGKQIKFASMFISLRKRKESSRKKKKKVPICLCLSVCLPEKGFTKGNDKMQIQHTIKNCRCKNRQESSRTLRMSKRESTTDTRI